jgi:multiple sugar transport system permease protein
MSVPGLRSRLVVVGRSGAFLLALSLAALFLFPLVWMLITSLKAPSEVFAQPMVWWPRVLQLSNYPDALSVFPFVRDLGNSLIVSLSTTVGTTLSSSLVAYGFARLRWRGRDALFLLVLATLMIPAWVTLVPLYILFNRMGWINTFLPLILPEALGGAFSIFLLRQFFLRQPRDLIDAALVDGASHLRIFFQIALPLAKPAVAVVAVFAFVDSWTDYINPLIYLTNPDLYTLQLGLFNFFGQHNVNWPGLMAASLLVMTPMVVLFLAAQRTFIEGVTFTGLRG